MKVNLKKLGAIVAGAAVLASSAAFAGLMFGSTTLVDDNGAPVAKVVVGSKALPSDGVAAALIAGKIAAETYKSQTLTAQVAGSASCKSDGSAAGTGTCSISNEKARLEITVPGSIAAGTYTFGNLIGDFVNRDLNDRVDNVDSLSTDYSKAAYGMTGSDTSVNANPFTDGSTGNIGPSEVYMYRISGQMYSNFADYTVSDSDAGNTYVEHQDMWVRGDNHYSTSSNEDVGKVSFLAYTLKFDGPGGDTVGVPVCTRADNLDYQICAHPPTSPFGVTTDDETSAHRVKVNFLGEQWVISEMNPPNDVETNENLLHSGGSVKLAKESIGGILNQGESLPVDNLKFQLDDLEAHGDTTSAIISVLDANGNVLKKDKIDQAQTKEFNVAGKNYRIHVYKVAPGYTFGAKWADMAVYSQELTLTDGQELDQDVGKNQGYTVALGWKNLDASAGPLVPDPLRGNPEKLDALRTIVIYSDSISDVSSSGDEELKVGDYVSVVMDPTAWKLSYKGLDLLSTDKKTLKFELKTSDLTMSQKFPDIDGDNKKETCVISAPYMRVSTTASGSVFESVDNTGFFTASTLSNNEFFVTLKYDSGAGFPAVTAMNCTATNGGGTLDVDTGAVVMKLSPSSSEYGIQEYSGGMNLVKYSAVGDGSTAFAPPDGGAILLQRNVDIGIGDQLLGDLFNSVVKANSGFTTAPPDIMFAVSEKAGTGTSNDFVDFYAFGVFKSDALTFTPSDALFQINTNWATTAVTSDNAKVFYGHATENQPTGNWCGAFAYFDGYYCPDQSKTGPVTSNAEMAEEGFVSERGSTFKSMDDRSVQFEMAHKLAHAQWFLAPASTNVSSGDKTVVTLGEGESKTVSGVTVKVLEITEDVGACSATGGAAACTSDMSGVSAVIMPNNAASVAVSMPYTGSYGNLVILDSDAVGVNTLISVGGDKVNSVTADLLQGSAVDWTATSKVVKEVVQGSKIVVAGAQKEDTLAAAQDFVSQVKRT
jgi:hypothetical protein